MRLTNTRIISLLRKEGYRVTPQRQSVLKVITQSGSHLSPSSIHKEVIKEHSGVGLTTVYRLLDTLTELNLLCKVSGKSNTGYLLRRPKGHHHHLVCNGCGKVFDFSNCRLNELENHLASKSGFAIEEHMLEFRGRCRSCRNGER